MVYLAPSILSADLLKLTDQIQIVAENGADFIHVDVMDAHFVPNLTFGPVMVRTLSRITDLPLDVHLMMTNPDPYLEAFAAAGAGIITVHQETCVHLDRTLDAIKKLGCKAGIALNPATPVQTLHAVAGMTDLILIMTVNPGFGGQKFIPYTLDKIRDLKQYLTSIQSKCLIEVDGGINRDTVRDVVEAGADVLVAGAAVFAQPDIAAACSRLKERANSRAREI